MPQITPNTKFIGIEQDLVNLSERKSNLINEQQNAFSLAQLSQGLRLTIDAVLEVSEWTLVDGLYQQTLSHPKISSNSYVAVVIFNTDIVIASVAEVLPQNESIDGGVIIYATDLAVSDINVTLNIFL